MSSGTGGLGVQDLGLLSVTADVNVPDIVLEPFEQLTGKLVLADGSPLAMMAASVRSRDSELGRSQGLVLKPLRSRRTTTDAEGWFRVAGLEAGKYVLSLADFLWSSFLPKPLSSSEIYY